MKIKQMVIASILFSLLSNGIAARISLSADGPAVDNSIYAELLVRYVEEGKVNYAGFQSEETKLDRYLDLLQGIDPETLTRNEQFAFYANVYNAWTIKLISCSKLVVIEPPSEVFQPTSVESPFASVANIPPWLYWQVV